MNKTIYSLIKINTLGAISNFTLSKNFKKSKFKQLVSVLTIIILILLSMWRIYYISTQMLKLGIIYELPIFYMITSSLLIFIYTIFKSESAIFKSNDNDFLLSLPINTKSILISRIVSAYFTNLTITMGIMLPILLSLGLHTDLISVGFLTIFILSLFFIPLIPMMGAMLLNMCVIKIALKTNFYSLVSVILNLACIILPFLYPLFVVINNSFSLKFILKTFMESYPIAYLYHYSLVNVNFGNFVIFAIASLLIAFIALTLFDRNFKKICSVTPKIKALNNNLKNTKLKNHSVFQALYKKELKKYFSSPLYVLNTAISPIILIVISGSLFFASVESLGNYLNTPEFSRWLKLFPCLVSSLIVSMCNITASSLSLESKNKWILDVIPVKPKTLYLSYILVHLTVTIPSVVISGIFFTITLQLNFLESLIQLFSPLAVTIFSAVFGLLMNVKFPNYNFKNESEVIKRGTAVLLAFFGSIFVALLPLIAGYLMSFDIFTTIEIAYIILLSLCTYSLYKYLCKQKIQPQ